MNKIIRFS